MTILTMYVKDTKAGAFVYDLRNNKTGETFIKALPELTETVKGKKEITLADRELFADIAGKYVHESDIRVQVSWKVEPTDEVNFTV
jgi:hypothetical protein